MNWKSKEYDKKLHDLKHGNVLYFLPKYWQINLRMQDKNKGVEAILKNIVEQVATSHVQVVTSANGHCLSKFTKCSNSIFLFLF